MAQIKALGCSRIAIHFDVDVVDGNKIIFGLGAEADGLTSNEARRLVADVSAIADVVGQLMLLLVRRKDSDRSRRQNGRARFRFQGVSDCDRDSTIELFAGVEFGCRYRRSWPVLSHLGGLSWVPRLC